MNITVETATEALRRGNNAKGGDYTQNGLLRQYEAIVEFFGRIPTHEEEEIIAAAIERGDYLH